MTRPMRSWMFVPGDRQRFLDKAAASAADAVFLDLEDGVLPDNKATARGLVADTLARSDFGPLRYVRVNAATTPWYADDLEAVLRPGLAGICLPKAEHPRDVVRLGQRLDEFERDAGIEPGSVGIVAAIEGALALVRAPSIAAACDRLVALMFGAEDYALDLGLGTARVAEAAELLYARSAIVVAAASARRLSIDGVFPNLDDAEGLEGDVLQSRRLGFTSKSTFNPRQLDFINTVFSPQPDEIAYARKVLDAFEAARAKGDASVAVGGQLVDLPIVRRAERTLELAQQLGIASSPVNA